MLSTRVPKPGRSRYGPSWPQPETLTTISPGLRRCSSAGASPIASSVPGRKFSISTWAPAIRSAKQFAAARRAQVQRHALFVARIDLPVDADPVGLPGAQRVAPFRVLDLDHLGAEIGELQADHVARHEPRHVDDPHPVERAPRLGLERFLGHAHRQGQSCLRRHHTFAAAQVPIRRQVHRSGA